MTLWWLTTDVQAQSSSSYNDPYGYDDYDPQQPQGQPQDSLYREFAIRQNEKEGGGVGYVHCIERKEEKDRDSEY